MAGSHPLQTQNTYADLSRRRLGRKRPKIIGAIRKKIQKDGGFDVRPESAVARRAV